MFADAGAKVILSDVDPVVSQRVRDQIRAAGGAAEFVPADLSTENGVRELIERAVASYGQLDGAFNNAGVEQHGKPLDQLTTSEWERTIRIDLTAVFWCLKFEIPAMLKSGGGSIVNMASGLGRWRSECGRLCGRKARSRRIDAIGRRGVRGSGHQDQRSAARRRADPIDSAASGRPQLCVIHGIPQGSASNRAFRGPARDWRGRDVAAFGLRVLCERRGDCS